MLRSAVQNTPLTEWPSRFSALANSAVVGVKFSYKRQSFTLSLFGAMSLLNPDPSRGFALPGSSVDLFGCCDCALRGAVDARGKSRHPIASLATPEVPLDCLAKLCVRALDGRVLCLAGDKPIREPLSASRALLLNARIAGAKVSK